MNEDIIEDENYTDSIITYGTELYSKNYNKFNIESDETNNESREETEKKDNKDEYNNSPSSEQKKRGRKKGSYGPYKKSIFKALEQNEFIKVEEQNRLNRNNERKDEITVNNEQKLETNLNNEQDVKLENISSAKFGKETKKSNILEPEPILEVKSISKTYKGIFKPVFTDLSFSLYRGDIVGILGENGAGKSTLLKCITGLTPLDGGNVKVCGLPLEQARERVSVLWVESGMNGGWTVRKNLEFWSLVYGIQFNEVDIKKALNSFGVGHLLDKEYKFLSTGQKRKVAIARTFIRKTDLYILDEATSGLDFTSQANIQEFIKGHERENNSAYLLVTHLYTDLINLCNKLMIIDSGKIADYDTTYSIKKRYLTGYVVTLLVEGETEIIDTIDDYLKARGAKYCISRKDTSSKLKPVYIKLDRDISEFNEYSSFLDKYSLQKKVEKLDLEVFVNLLMGGIIFSGNEYEIQ